MENDYQLDDLEKKSKLREEKRRKEKEMKTSGKSVFKIQEIIKEKDDKGKS